jgi:ubiquitin-like protein Pup
MGNADLHSTASHESVRAVLHGKFTRWEVLEAVGHQLALMAHPPQDPAAVGLALIQEWNRASEVADGELVTVVKEAPKTAPSEKGQAYSDELFGLLDEMDQVLEQDADDFMNGFVQGRGGVDVEPVEEILERFSQIAPLLAGEVNEPPPDLLIDLLIVLLILLMPTSTYARIYRRNLYPSTYGERESNYRSIALRAVESSPRTRFSQVSDLLRDLQFSPSPAGIIRNYLRSGDDAFASFVEDWCVRDPQLVPFFQEGLKDLIELAHGQALARRRERQRSRRVRSAERIYRQAVIAKRFDEARVAFEILAREDQACADDLRLQTGFVWLEDPDRDVMAGLWGRLAVGNLTELAIHDESSRSGVGPERDKAQSMHHASAPTPVSAVPPRRAVANTAAGTAGSSRDFDPGGLLRSLFRLSEAQAKEMARQLSGRGREQTRPCEFRAVPVDAQTPVCHVLCYRSASPLTVATLGPDVMRRERILANDGVDYLVVLSFGSEIESELQELAADWNAREAYPFAVRLFGAAALSRAAVRPEMLRASLLPRLRLSERWVHYLKNPALLTFPGEDHRPLDLTYQVQLPTRFADDHGTPLPGTAFDQVHGWLDSNKQGLVVLGGFGDGKTFFTYNLARRLCEDSQSTPERIRVPLRLALRDLPDMGSARELLSRRLNDLGIGMADWQLLVNVYPTLVILDGFDEMSADLSKDSILRNIKLLRDCYRLFSTSKILLTSRGGAFGPPADQERLFERINKPGIVHLRQFERSDVLASLFESAQDATQQRKIDRLQSLHDPIELATKPLYLAMIRDTLPHLPLEDFTEKKLYETYVTITLHRKLEYLEDKYLQVGEKDLVRNLLAILERVATELHRTNARYVHLQDLDLRGLGPDGDGQGLARVLWRITTEGGERASEGVSNEDAIARVGMRSLLKTDPDGEAERWPVDFSHRSMREYFVGRAIASAVAAGTDDPPVLLKEAKLSPEVLRFAALILQSGLDEPASHRLKRWARSVSVDDVPSLLGGNALSLLYASLGEVPDLDWSCLRLDYAQLPGANLEGRSFRGSSLQHANLDNANLTGTDLRNADLSGVRLEETASVTGVAVGQMNTLYVAYGDKSLRQWDISPAHVTDRVLHTLPHLIEHLWLTPRGRLVVVGESFITVLNEINGEWQPIARFRLKSHYRLPDFTDPMALLADERTDGMNRLIWFDPVAGTGSVTDLPGIQSWSVLGRQGYAAASTNRVFVHLDDVPGEWADELVSIVALRANSSQEVLVAVGHQDGTVQLFKLSRTANELRRTEVWNRHLHVGPVTAVAFLSADRMVTGGVDRGLCVVSTAPSDTDDRGEVARFELTLRCRGVRVDGMRGDRERNLLRRLAARQK